LLRGFANVGIPRATKMDNEDDVIFFPSALHTIHPYKIFGKRCMLEEDGDNMRLRIMKRLHYVDAKVCVDFEGVGFCTHHFLRGAFGMLIGDMTIDEINDRIFLIGTSRSTVDTLNVVMRHCAKCFSEEQNKISLNY